jgi:hypothetical protein
MTKVTPSPVGANGVLWYKLRQAWGRMVAMADAVPDLKSMSNGSAHV